MGRIGAGPISDRRMGWPGSCYKAPNTKLMSLGSILRSTTKGFQVDDKAMLMIKPGFDLSV